MDIKRKDEFIKDMFYLELEWNKLLKNKKMTKKAIIDLCVPFRDKYNLTDKQALCIARGELTTQEIVKMLESEVN